MKKILALLLLLTSVFSIAEAQLATPFSQRKTWDGLYDIKMIAAPNLEAAYLDATQAAGSVLKVDSLVRYETMVMSGTKLNINNIYKGGTPFKQVSVPLPSVICPDPDAACMQGLTKNTANATCGTERYNTPGTVSKYVSMTYADYDTDMSTYSSSMADLSIPNCSEIQAAYLYWTGNIKNNEPAITLATPTASYNGTGDVFNTTLASGYNSVKFKSPGGTYQNVTADVSHILNIVNGTPTATLTSGSYNYLCISDVTSLVKGTGSGNFWVANLQTYPNDGEGGSTSGWNLVVVFRSPLSTRRIISLWDGFQDVAKGGKQTLTLTGIQAPAVNNFKSYVGFAALDGENIASQIAGNSPVTPPEGLGFQTNGGGSLFSINPFATDQASYKLWNNKGYPAKDDLTDNLDANGCKVPQFDASWASVFDGISSSHITTYNETTGKNGNEVVRLPSNKNTLGFDAHHLKLPDNAIAGGATTATLTVNAGPQGSTIPYIAYIAIELLQPKLIVEKTADKITTELSTTITYNLKVKNIGNDKSLGNINGGDMIYDTLDVVTNYIGGSFTAPANVSLVSSANDRLQINMTNVINAGDSIEMSFKVLVKDYPSGKPWYDACKRTILNTAYINYNTTSSGQILEKSNAALCGTGSETKVLIVDGSLANTTTKTIGPLDATSYRTDAVIPHVQSEILSAGVLPADISKYEIRDSSGNLLAAGDVFPATGNTVSYFAIRDYPNPTVSCQEKYEVQFTFDLPCRSDSGKATTTALNKAVCVNGSATIKLTGFTGTIQWESSTNPAGGWANVTGGSGANTDTYSTGPLTVNTYFRANVLTGTCTPASSTIDSVLISPPSTGGNASASPTSICSGAASTLNLAGQTSGASIQWEQSATGSGPWVNVTGGFGATTPTYNTPGLSATTYYRAMVTSGACPSIASALDTVIVNPTSFGGTATATPPAICSNTSSTVQLSGHTGTNIQWEQSANGITGWINAVLGTGATTTSYTTPALTATTYYRAKVISGACPSDNSAMDTVTVTPISVGGTASTASPTVCSNSPAILTLGGGYVGDIQWQEAISATGPWINVSLGSGAQTATYTTKDLIVKTFFRAKVTSGTCTYDSSNVVSVGVDSISKGGTASTATPKVCSNNTAVLKLAGSVGTIQWQESSTGLAPWTNVTTGSGAQTQSFTTKSLTVKTFYRVKTTSGTCAYDSSNVISVDVDSISKGGTASTTSPAVCSNNTAILELTGSVGTIQWQESVSGTAPWINVSTGSGAQTSTYTTKNLTVKTFYRAKATSGTCAYDSSNVVSIDVDSTSEGGTASTATPKICSNSTAIIKLAGSVGAIQWQESTTGLAPWTNVTTGSGAQTQTFTSKNLTAKTFYRVKATSGTCAYDSSNVISVDVDSVSVGGTATALKNEFCASGSTTISLSGQTGNSVQWQISRDNITWKDTAVVSPFLTAVLKQTTYYRAKVTSGSCSAETSAVATVTISTGSVGGIVASPKSLCQKNATVLSLASYKGTSIQWQQSANGINGWVNATPGTGDTTTTYTTPPLDLTTYYHVIVRDGSCVADTSNIEMVTVIPVPPFSAGKDSLICQGTQYSLTASPGFTNYQWWNGSGDQSIVIMGPGIYWVKAATTTGCPVIDSVIVATCNITRIPNVYTPNGDPFNQEFIIQGNVPNSHLQIFNRWGTEVYSNKSYDNTWDGRGCTDGIYYYIYKRPADKEAHRGWVEIIGKLD